MIEKWAVNHNVKAIVSFEVSSDDEGILVSFIADEDKLKGIIPKFRGLYPRMKKSVDGLFGVQTSFEKTTITWSDWFEFNSKFYMGNSIVSPIIKFVARAVDDNPQESLGRRVASLYSSLRQLRE